MNPQEAQDAAPGLDVRAAGAGQPSLAAKALGDASATADQDIAEIPREDLQKADVTPPQIEDLKTADDDVPAVGEGDDDRPMDPGLSDLGWSEEPDVPVPMLHGTINEDIWLMTRRFNRQTWHIKKMDEPPLHGIDMNIADEDKFNPDKLKSTLERFYLTVLMGVMGFVKHIARLRSWTEKRRTGFFLAAYVGAWLLDIVVPAITAFVMLLCVSPRSRRILFPPMPLALVSAKDGSVKVPPAGHLGSDSLTGAQETYRGEAAEQEASNVVGSISKLAVSTAVGGGGATASEAHLRQAEDDDSDDEGSVKATDAIKAKAAVAVEGVVPDPAKAALAAQEAQAAGTASDNKAVADTTAEAVDSSIWAKLQPTLHVLEDICDTWERFGNALSPKPPFKLHRTRVFLASLLVPVCLGSLFITVHMVYRGLQVGFAFGFFGQPLIDRVKVSDLRKWLDKRFPGWPKYLELRHTILKGVPTDAQVTITWLRIGETNKAPLAPPPPADETPEPTATDASQIAARDDIPEEYKEQMQQAAAAHAQEKAAERDTGNDADSNEGEPKRIKKRSRILALFKGATAAGMDTALAANRVKAEAGFEGAKTKVGVVTSNVAKDAKGQGPAAFNARYRGKQGLLIISQTHTTPCVSFERKLKPHEKLALATAEKAAKQAENKEGDQKAMEKIRAAAEKARPPPLFSIQIEDLVEMRKLGGLGWKGKLVVSWALEREVTDGIEIKTATGDTYIVTALARRDDVFNRLAALGKQYWEIW